MAKTDQQATKRAAPSKARKSAKPKATLKQLESETRALKKERDELRGQLMAAKQRIDELQTINEGALNRIDWVLDSLHSLLEKKP